MRRLWYNIFETAGSTGSVSKSYHSCGYGTIILFARGAGTADSAEKPSA